MDDLTQKLADYAPSDEALELVRNTKVMFLVGPAGAGKDTVKHQLLTDPKYKDIVSHTTRAPRLNHGEMEVDGREYHFIDQVEVLRMLNNQEFIEAKQVHGSNVYGTSVAEIRTAHDQHLIALTDLEVQGVAEFKAIDPSIIAIFLLPPSFEIWQDRLQKRYGEMVEHDDYIKRMRTAIAELQIFIEAGYYTGIINDSLDTTIAQIERIAAGEAQSPAKAKAAEQLAQQLLAATQSKLEHL